MYRALILPAKSSRRCFSSSSTFCLPNLYQLLEQQKPQRESKNQRQQQRFVSSKSTINIDPAIFNNEKKTDSQAAANKPSTINLEDKMSATESSFDNKNKGFSSTGTEGIGKKNPATRPKKSKTLKNNTPKDVKSRKLNDNDNGITTPRPETSLDNQIDNNTQPLEIKEDTRLPFTIDMNFIDHITSVVQDPSKTFVSLDIEQFERNTSIVTEIGISVYLPPQPLDGNGQSQSTNNPIPIIPDIRASHLIVKEHNRHRNGRFVEDNRYNFSFGKSVFLSQSGCVSLINQVLKQSMGSQKDLDDSVKLKEREMNLVLVGHNVKGDISALKAIGVEFPKNHQILDTQHIWRHTRKEGPCSLENLLKIFRVPYQFLHNAGNDAYLTLVILLKLCDPVVRASMRLNEPASQEEIDSYPKSSRKMRHKHPEPPTADELIRMLVRLR